MHLHFRYIYGVILNLYIKNISVIANISVITYISVIANISVITNIFTNDVLLFVRGAIANSFFANVVFSRIHRHFPLPTFCTIRSGHSHANSSHSI